ncbi:MAG: hypothetical protein AAGB12_11195 [Pseudomonadota bacterium]
MSYTYHMLSEMVDSKHSLFYINTDATHTLASKLLEFQKEKDIASYRWQRGYGIWRNDLPGVYAPGSTTFCKALQFVANTPYLGIFLFENVGSDIIDTAIDPFIQRLAHITDDTRRICLITGIDLKIPEDYAPLFREHRYQALDQSAIKHAANR